MKLYTNDLYCRVGEQLVYNGYWQLEDNQKKELVLEQLRKYTLNRIIMTLDIECSEKTCLEDSLNILYNSIENGDEALDSYIHYINIIIGSMQGYEVIWHIEKDPAYIDAPCFEYKDNLLDSLHTHEEASSLETLLYVINEFKTNFKTETKKELVK